MDGFCIDKKPLTNHANDAVHWFLNELKYRIVAESGKPSDSCHLGKLILQSLKDDPQFILQIDGSTGTSETFGSILQRTVQCANGLRKLGVNTGDVMILMAPNHLDLAIPFYAALYLGIIIAPIDIHLRINELEDTFRIDNPKIIFCQNNRLTDVVEAANRTGLKPTFVTFDKGDNNALSFADFLMHYGNDVTVDDFRCSDFDPISTISILLSTSGTTGKPKSAAVSHRSFGMSIPYLWTRYTKFPTPTKMAFIVSPLQWLSAIMSFLISPIMRYTRLQSALPMIQEHAYELINKYKPTYMIVSPTMMTTLIKPGDREKCDFTCFETLIIGGSAVHKNLIAEVKFVNQPSDQTADFVLALTLFDQRGSCTYVFNINSLPEKTSFPSEVVHYHPDKNWQKITPKTNVLESYGLSEATTLVFQENNPLPGSCGKPIGLFQYKLIDPTTGAEITKPHVPGELRIYSPALFTGYFNNPEETKAVFEDGWIKTGDIFYRDENWNFFFVDRLKQLLKYKNHQISPVEVEGVIRQHPSVLDVAVVGLPDPECGDLPVACVVPRPGHTIKADEIKNLVKDNLTDTKQLRGGVIFMPELPATATTKLHRQKLKEIVMSAHRE